MTADVVIVGGGIMGLSCAYHLALRHCGQVVVLEKAAVCGTGASGENAGGIRHQFSTAVNIELSKLSVCKLRRFREDTGQEIDLRFCGYLFLLDNESDLHQFEANVSLQRSLGVRTQLLSRNQIEEMIPRFTLEGILGGTFNPDDGIADPAGVVQGYLSRSLQLGVTLCTNTPALGLVSTGSKVAGVRTPEGVVATENVIIAAGPWSGEVGESSQIQIPVQPLRRQILVTRPLHWVTPSLPFVVDFSRALYFHYEGGGILTGMSNPAETPGFRPGLDEEWRLIHLEEAVRRLPLLADAELQAEWSGHYEMTPDHQPILGRVAALDGIFACTGFSGHGFMHGPACGQLLAEEILDGRAHSININPLRWERFSGSISSGEYNVI